MSAGSGTSAQDSVGTRIITFYSFKGGVGRTMALANVAWILASAGRRVLTVDWDLESPGLHRYFRPFLRDRNLTSNTGVIDLFMAYGRAMSNPGRIEDPAALRWQLAALADHVQTLDWPDFPGAGRIDVLGPGRQDDAYDFNVATLPWHRLLDRPEGQAFIEALRGRMRDGTYDYVLLDSRTGVADIVGVCTQRLPDTVVLCLAMNNQAIEGGARAAAQIVELAPRDVRLVPVLSRVDLVDDRRRLRRLAHVRRVFRAPLTALTGVDDFDEHVRFLARLQVPYRAYYSYEEVLATFADQLGEPRMVLGAYERLTEVVSDGEVTRMPQIPLTDSYRVVDRFDLLSGPDRRRIAVWAAPQDLAWRDWVRAVLLDAGADVVVLADDPASDAGPAEDLARGTDGDPTDGDLADGDLADGDLADGGGRGADSDVDAVVLVVSAQLGLPSVDDSVARSRVERYATAPASDPTTLTVLRVADGPVPEPYDRLARISIAARDAGAVRAALLDRFGLPAGGVGGLDPLDEPRYPGTAPEIWNLRTRNALFVGREGDLTAVRDTLRRAGPAIGRCALLGVTGVGKSSLALEFAHRFAADYDLVWWIDAEDATAVRRGLVDLAARLGLRDQAVDLRSQRAATQLVRTVLDVLRRGGPQRRWLLVYDGAGDPGVLGAERLIPDGGAHQHVLVTSRDAGWDQVAAARTIAALPRADSLRYLAMRLPGAERADLDGVAGELADHPLALVNAAGSIRGTELDYPAAIERFRRDFARLGGSGGADGAVTWNVTYSRLRRDDDPFGRAEARLVEILARFSPQGVSVDLVGSPTMMRRIGLAADGAALPDAGPEPMLRALAEHALAEVDLTGGDRAAGTVRMHPAVQAQIRDQLAAEGRDAEVAAAALDVLAAYAPPSSQPFGPAQYPAYEELHRHIASSGATRSTRDDVRRWLVWELYYLNQTGQWGRAIVLGEECLRRWRATVGPDDPLTLRLASDLADAYRSSARFEEAFDLDSETLARQRRELGTFDTQTLVTAMSLGADKRSRGWYRDAWAEDQATWDGLRRTRGAEDRYTVDAAHNFALSLLLAGETQEALRLSREVLGLRARLLGADSDTTAWATVRVAICLLELGEYDEALSLFQDSAGRLENLLGVNALRTLRARKHQAVALRRMGDLAFAADLTDATLAGLRRHYGDDDPVTVACQLSAAADRHARGEYAEAVRLAAGCLGDYGRMYGAEHPFTDACRTNLSVYRLADGDVIAAAQDSVTAHARLGEVLFPYHPLAIAAAVNHANVLVAAGDLTEAAELEAVTAEICLRYLGASHPSTRVALGNLAATERLGMERAGGERLPIELDISTI